MTAEEAFSYAATLCNRAEYCTSEIAAKLRTKGLAASDVARVLEALREQRLIDDRRFAIAFVRQKFRDRRWGRRKIEMELRRKRIAPDTIAEALGCISDRDYAAALTAVLTAKARLYPRPLDRADLNAIARTAISRGFEPALVFQALSGI